MAQKEKQPLLPVYLVMGADDLKRGVVLKRLRQRLAAEGDIEFNSQTFDGADALGEEIVTACNTLPFASPVRLVHVRDCDKMPTAEREPIIDYLRSPADTTVLCLESPGLQKNSRLYKAVLKLGKQTIIDCAPPKRRDLPAQVRAMATPHGITLTPGAAEALVDRVGENTVALDGQLKKLALAHVGVDPVNESEVIAQVAATAEMKPWDFTDAFSQRNISKCLYIRSRLEGTSAFALLGMCVTRIRELIIARSLMQRGQVQALATVLHQPAWRVKNHVMWAKGFTSEELRQALVRARDAEMAMKSGADVEATFQSWWLSVLVRK